MKNKKSLIVIVGAVMVVLVMAVLIGTHTICIFHEWMPATCVTAETCKHCGAVQGTSTGHDWMDATCTVPATCENCGSIKGKPLGHTNEYTTTVRDCIVEGYSVTEKYCKRCGEVVEEEVNTYTTLISGNALMCTPSELMERLKNAFDEINGCALTTTIDYYEGKMFGVVRDPTGYPIAMVRFNATNGNWINDTDAHGVKGILMNCFDETEYVPHILLGYIIAFNPSSTLDEAMSIADSIINSGNKMRRYNGLTYIIAYDDGWMIGIAIE